MHPILKRLDIFGSNPSLYINKHAKFRSYTGLSFTVILGIIAVVCTILFGKELILK